jgi:hypothetical protein
MPIEQLSIKRNLGIGYPKSISQASILKFQQSFKRPPLGLLKKSVRAHHPLPGKEIGGWQYCSFEQDGFPRSRGGHDLSVVLLKTSLYAIVDNPNKTGERISE